MSNKKIANIFVSYYPISHRSPGELIDGINFAVIHIRQL